MALKIEAGQTWRDNLRGFTLRVLGSRAGMVQVERLSESGKLTGKRSDIWYGLFLELFNKPDCEPEKRFTEVK